jgi:hypothetical protein
MSTKMSNLKKELKAIAVKIKEVKIETKKIQKNHGYAGNLQYGVDTGEIFKNLRIV